MGLLVFFAIAICLSILLFKSDHDNDYMSSAILCVITWCGLGALISKAAMMSGYVAVAVGSIILALILSIKSIIDYRDKSKKQITKKKYKEQLEKEKNNLYKKWTKDDFEIIDDDGIIEYKKMIVDLSILKFFLLVLDDLAKIEHDDFKYSSFKVKYVNKCYEDSLQFEKDGKKFGVNAILYIEYEYDKKSGAHIDSNDYYEMFALISPTIVKKLSREEVERLNIDTSNVVIDRDRILKNINYATNVDILNEYLCDIAKINKNVTEINQMELKEKNERIAKDMVNVGAIVVGGKIGKKLSDFQ